MVPVQLRGLLAANIYGPVVWVGVLERGCLQNVVNK